MGRAKFSSSSTQSGPWIVPKYKEPQNPEERAPGSDHRRESRYCSPNDRKNQREPTIHRVKLSPFPALSSSSCEKLKSGFIRSSWRFRPSTIICKPTLSAHYIGPPRSTGQP